MLNDADVEGRNTAKGWRSPLVVVVVDVVLIVEEKEAASPNLQNMSNRSGNDSTLRLGLPLLGPLPMMFLSYRPFIH